ncbi:MAG: PDZ domain-containing protein [Planctomycetes bacterium]|nr:PDZ domain-containing protein [Planctomycetota bacterium]
MRKPSLARSLLLILLLLGAPAIGRAVPTPPAPPPPEGEAPPPNAQAAPPAPQPPAVPPPVQAPSGRQVLEALSQVVEENAARFARTLVYVEVQMDGDRAVRGTGLILAADGQFLFPARLDKDRVRRIRAWVGEKELSANLLKADDRLRFSMLKLPASAGPYTPLALGTARFPKRGEWLVSMLASGKERDFQLFTSLHLVRGIVPGEVDELVVSNGAELSPGAFLADAAGVPIALVRADGGAHCVVLRDIRRRLDDLARGAAEPGTATISAREDGEPWLGVTLGAMNEDYAEASSLPKSAIWILEVCKGSPADKAGIRSSDLIVGVDGCPIDRCGERASEQFFKLLAPEVGREVALEVLRGADRQRITCKLEQKPKPRELLAEDLGIEVQEITDLLFHTKEDVFVREGVLVKSVVEGSPAATSQTFGRGLLDEDDVIVALGGRPTPTVEAFAAALSEIRKSGQACLLLKLRRGVRTTHVALNLALKHSRKGEEK